MSGGISMQRSGTSINPLTNRTKELTDNEDISSRQYRYLEELKNNLILNWDDEFKYLLQTRTDCDYVLQRLRYFSLFVNILADDRMIKFTLGIGIYTAITYLVVEISAGFFIDSIAFNAAFLVVFAVTLLSIVTVKGRIFGPLVVYPDRTDDFNMSNIGYYQLLDLKYKYLSIKKNNIRDTIAVSSLENKSVNSHMIKKGFIWNHQWKWMLFLVVNVVANIYNWIFALCTINESARIYGKYYYYLVYATGYFSIVTILCLIAVSYVVMLAASLIHGSYAIHEMVVSWNHRLGKVKTMSLVRYRALRAKFIELTNDDKSFPTVNEIRIDLYERYLFIFGALSHTSDLFNFILAVICSSCIIFFFVFAYFWFVDYNIMFIQPMIYTAVAFFFVVLCLSYANSSVGSIALNLKATGESFNTRFSCSLDSLLVRH